MQESEGSDIAADTSAAVGIALGAAARDAGVAAEARAYLKKQVELANYQIADLRREDVVRHWSLRVRHISDLMKLTFEVALAFIFVAIALGIAAALFSAAHDDSLVIDAFSVPPDMAARGLTGQVVAAQFQDKLVAMQNATLSARPAESYASNWGNDIKVEIPNTGVSISELYRYLASWLGHQTHITGDVFRTANGLSVTVRAGEGASTATGAEADMDKLLQQAAEKTYLRTQPYRYAVYLEFLGPGRLAEARRIFENLATTGSLRERAWAWNGLARLDSLADDLEHAIRDYRQTLALAPNFALAYVNLDSIEGILGHDEASLVAAQNAVRLLRGGGDVEMSAIARTISLPAMEADVAFAQNDFNSARTFEKLVIQLPDYGNDIEGARQSLMVSAALLHDPAGLRREEASLPPSSDTGTLGGRAATKLFADYWLGRWPSVLAEWPTTEAISRKGFAEQGSSPRSITQFVSLQIWPYAATALAMTGNIAAAKALIDKTPLDCYTCLRNRARIAEAEHNWPDAQRWYERATSAAPSIPIGYSEWGRMLLEEGDIRGALAKFAIAHQKGPHFADPLELSGEALMMENRADLAVAKFAEASRDAPDWGRLHLKWGEALYYAGNKVEAKAQFEIAHRLDLSAAERAALEHFYPTRKGVH